MKRIVAAALVASAVVGGALRLGPGGRGRTGQLPVRLSDAAFWQLVTDLSEAGGSFISDNFVSNESTFQRVIPDFEPSPDSYALAVDQLEKTRARIRAAGFDSDRHLDLWTAMLTGLVDQQISNDPGGKRWQRRIDDAVDMFFEFATATSTQTH